MDKQKRRQAEPAQLERRTVSMTELRVLSEGDEEATKPIIEGHAAVFNQWSEELGWSFPFREKVMPGAFKETIQVDDIRALFNHDPNYVLGRNRSGTLELKETQKGLLVRITPPETQWARDLLVSIDRGDISQMSFGFLVIEDRWGTEDGGDIRELHKVKLFDVSPVTFPAYPQTDVGVRGALLSYERHLKELSEAEESRARQRLALIKRKIELL